MHPESTYEYYLGRGGSTLDSEGLRQRAYTRSQGIVHTRGTSSTVDPLSPPAALYWNGGAAISVDNETSGEDREPGTATACRQGPTVVAPRAEHSTLSSQQLHALSGFGVNRGES